MKITFKDVCSSGNLEHSNLEFETMGCTVLHDPVEKQSRSILDVLAGLEDVERGRLLIDGQEYHDYMAKRNLLEVFSYVFDEGIMLANLSLRENMLLPWKKRFEDRGIDQFDSTLQDWIKRFGIQTDLSLRPALIDPAERKFLGLIRSIMVQPELLIIDDPYYLFNKTERTRMLSYLLQLKPTQNMLIASADDDFLEGFADRVIHFPL